MKRLLFVDNSVGDHYDASRPFPDSCFPMPFHRVNFFAGDPVPDLAEFTHIISTGCTRSVCQPEPWMEKLEDLLREALERDRSLLGICFSHQALAKVLGGAGCVRQRPAPEMGWVEQTVIRDDPLFGKDGDRLWGLEAHFDEVTTSLPPEKATIIMRSDTCQVEAFRVNGKNAWGVQGHFEETPENGKQMLETLAAEKPELRPYMQNLDSPRDSGYWQTLFRRFCDLD